MKENNTYPKFGFLPLFAFFERQLSLPLRLRFPIFFSFQYDTTFLMQVVNLHNSSDLIVLLVFNTCNNLPVLFEKYTALLQ